MYMYMVSICLPSHGQVHAQPTVPVSGCGQLSLPRETFPVQVGDDFATCTVLSSSDVTRIAEDAVVELSAFPPMRMCPDVNAVTDAVAVMTLYHRVGWIGLIVGFSCQGMLHSHLPVVVQGTCMHAGHMHARRAHEWHACVQMLSRIESGLHKRLGPSVGICYQRGI